VARPLSFRFRILALVLGVAIVPLVLMGAALVRGAARSGEQLLSERLDRAADDTRDAMIRRWIPLRSSLLDVSEWPQVGAAALGTVEGAHAELTARLMVLDPRIREVEIRTARDGRVFRFDRSALTPEEGGLPPPTRPLLRVDIAIPVNSTDLDASATTEFGLEGDLLLPRDAQPASAAGMVVSLLDPGTGASLLPIPLDASVLEGDRFEWGGETWMAARRSFSDPPLNLVLTAPLAPYVDPFRRSARNGAIMLAVVAIGALIGAALLAKRMTRSLRALVHGADAVTAGDLTHRIIHEGGDEIGRVATAFNNMTDSLQRTLRERASRESLAAVGEFAASLAHEVRNPLTAVKIDLQSLEERLQNDPDLREPLLRALEEIDRLDATVGGALSMVRHGDGDRVLDLRRPIEAAVHSAAPAFAERGAALDSIRPEQPLEVLGDAAALEQLFLNILLNAAEALSAGGRAEIRATRDGDTVQVRVEDDGPGISEEIRDRIFDPLFSTKETGTGLGLTISRRIVEAHRGRLDISGCTGDGTSVAIDLPAAPHETDPSDVAL
jgi:signal transduction histidine kinase